MSQVILDQATLDKLVQYGSAVEVLDPAGNIVGRFLPGIHPPSWGPQISQEEIERRVREESGRGRRLKDILADLEQRQ